jgi:hypothetical protein
MGFGDYLDSLPSAFDKLLLFIFLEANFVKLEVVLAPPFWKFSFTSEAILYCACLFATSALEI